MRYTFNDLTRCIIALMSVISLTYLQAQPEAQMFAYLTFEDSGAATVQLVHPETLEVQSLITFAGHPDEYIGTAFLNHARGWLMVQFFDAESTSLRLFDLTSGNEISVMEAMDFPNRPQSINGDYPVFAWSPNGQYAAFHTKDEEDGQDLYLYSLATQTLTALGNPTLNQYQLTWSPDGEQIAVISQECNELACSHASLDIYRASTLEQEHTIDITAYAGNQYTENTAFCELRWNADASAISFLDFCNGSGIGAPRELQIVDIANETVMQATALAPTNIEPARSMFQASVSTEWIDSSSLLMGVRTVTGEIFVPSSVTDTTYTAQYNRTDNSISIINTRRLGNWELTQNGLLAYLVYLYSTNEEGSPALTDANIEIGRFEGGKLITKATGPSGCFLSWNKNGHILAYLGRNVHAMSLCEHTFDTLHFLTVDGLNTFHIEQNAIALGWLNTN